MQQPAATLRLHASRSGSGAPLPSPGSTVHSVYRAALNVATPGGLLVLAPDASGGLPNGILLAEAPDFRSLRLSVGDGVTRAGSVLRVGAALAVDLGGARPWSALLSPITRDDEAMRRWQHRSAAAHHLADQHAHPRGLDAVDGARHGLQAVARAVALRDPRGAALAARRLIGLGPGLTPSGDDALAGLAAALRAVAHPSAGFLAGALDDVDVRTTAVSAALLRHAVRGEFTERIHRLLAALLGPDDAVLSEAMGEAASWGATSGSDTITGALIGLDAAAGIRQDLGAAA